MNVNPNLCETCPCLIWCLGHKELWKYLTIDNEDIHMSRCVSCRMVWIRAGHIYYDNLGDKRGTIAASFWSTALPHCIPMLSIEEKSLICEHCMENPDSNYYKAGTP